MGGFFLALNGDTVVGCVITGYDGHRGSISYLGVDLDRQVSGVGRLMTDHSEQFLFGLGCPKINLLVRTGNEPVLAFYEKVMGAPSPENR
ncbi:MULTISPECIES: GNAT family N-acetyltransferase [unclassified Roseibium]|uniref:GNAT family N-acetyltransferase n=1 Tax=unclassified Roseibium TaxID=2629323 RepID=UPI00273E85C7|nr:MULTISPECIES: GNAT family N-acetyltransferase [unclassified Roseibium]